MIDDEINAILKELETDVKSAMEKASKDLAKEGVTQLKAKSPRRTGKYAAGWRQRKNKDVIVLHNANKPSLTHILEHGYTAKNGKRVTGQPHIEKVEDFINSEIDKRIEKLLK